MVLLALGFVIGAVERQRGPDRIDVELTLRNMLEDEVARQNAPIRISDVGCVREAGSRYECIVTGLDGGQGFTTAGTLTCEGNDAGDRCIWRGELRGG